MSRTSNTATSTANDAAIRREAETRERQLAEVDAELARFSASGAVNADAGGEAAPPVAPPSAVLSTAPTAKAASISTPETPEAIAARLITERDQATALGQALVDLTLDAETAALVLKAKGATVEFEDGSPRFRIDGQLVAVDRASLAKLGISPFLIRSAGAPGSGGRTPEAAHIGDDAYSVKQKALDSFEYYKTNRARLLKMREQGTL